MAIDGVSYESGELIEEVKEEIKLYGNEHKAFAVFRTINGIQFVTDYFLYEEEMRDTYGLAEDEIAVQTTLQQLLAALKKQDEVI